MKRLLYIALIFLTAVGLTPGLAWAADEISIDSNAVIYLSGTGITLTVSDGGVVDSLSIGTTSFSVGISTNSAITVTSANRYELNNDGGFQVNCQAGFSSVTISGPTAATVTVTPTTNACSSGGGGGGGGAGPAPTTDSTAPGLPTGLAVSKVSDTSVKLAWTNPTDSDFSHVVIYRSTMSGDYGSAVHNNITGAEKTDTGLASNTTYYYALRAADTTGNLSGYTAQISINLATQETGEEVEPVTPPATAPEEVSETPGVPATDSQGKATLGQMAHDAAVAVSGDVNQFLAEMGAARDLALEAEYSRTLLGKILGGLTVDETVKNALTNFITYGTKASKILGAGERAGVLNSYREAFGKLPQTAADWNDVIKIANGRWPNERSQAKEDKATETFKKIYLRSPDRSNPHDDAAVTVMAYGLRPADRNLDSEKAAIKSFKAIFGYSPISATDWDAVRAIAYSGATR